MGNNKLKKAALMTDLHLGRKNNSEEHNKDCFSFIKWFCANVKKDPTIDHVWFLGDWHEHRSAINGLTLKYSYNCAKELNELGIPIYFILGNHDLFFRASRDVYSTEIFTPLSNFIIIDQIQKIDDIVGGVLAVPYLFEEEYPQLLKHSSVPIVMGHLNLQGFVLTGETFTLKHGPDHKDFFKNQKRVFSGHFHKRQNKDNVHYIGNTFPMDFSDANDNERGMAVYDYDLDKLTYIDWDKCPKYINCRLSDIMEDNSNVLIPGARVKCLVDVEISYSESIELKNMLSTDFELKELFFIETEEKQDILENTSLDESQLDTQSTHELIKSMLQQIVSEKIDKDLLVKIYEGIK